MSEKFRNKYRVQSARLQGYDYRNAGAYFITICTQHRIHYFGECKNGMMQSSAIGLLAEQFWFDIPNHFPNTSLGAFVVMPNHIHGILVIDEKWETPRMNPFETTNEQLPKPPTPSVETHNYASLQPATDSPATDFSDKLNIEGPPINEYFRNLSAPAKSVSTIIRAYKAAVTTASRKMGLPFAWQTRFHDHIIRNHSEYERISHYIQNNPATWKDDRFC